MRKVLDALEVPEAYLPREAEPEIIPPAPSGAHARAKLDKLGIATICEMITEGLGVRDIAARADVSRGSVLTWLDAPGHSARVRDARMATAWLWDEEAENAIRIAAAEPAELTRARELAFHFRWRAGKLNQAIYGDRTKHDVSGEIVHLTGEQRQAEISRLLAKRGEPLTLERGAAAADAAD